MTRYITQIRYGFAMAALLATTAGFLLFSAPQKAEAAVFTIASSTRFISGNSAYLSKTPASAGNRQVWTFSAWIKRSALTVSGGSGVGIFAADVATSDTGRTNIFFGTASGFTNDALYITGHSTYWRVTNALFRDPAVWNHLVVAWNTATGVAASDRIKVYVNGVQVTNFATSNDPSAGTDYGINQAGRHEIGSLWSIAGGVPAGFYDGYMSDIYFVDGQALDPTYFGASDSNGYWRPKTYTGTYGTNGFHLPLMGTSTAAGIGIDTSGNNNTWTVNNIATTDLVKDSPTNSFNTLSPIWQDSSITLSQGNLKSSASGVNDHRAAGTMAVSGGKYCFEAVRTDAVGIGNQLAAGVTNANVALASTEYANAPTSAGGASSEWMLTDRGVAVNNTTYSDIFGDINTNDVIQVCVDMSQGSGSNKIWFGRNGTFSGNPAAGTGAAFSNLPASVAPLAYSYSGALAFNFGQLQYATSTATASTYNSSAGGYFFYAPPAGFKALSTNNLPTPAIQKPKNYFDAYAYTGTGAATSSTHFAFSPSLVWIKNRTDAASHAIFDSVRGAQKFLSSDSSAVEDTDDTQSLSAFTSTGFSLGSGASTANVNTSAKNYISWLWKESPTAGFDIVTDTGTGVAKTVSHSLGVAPSMIIRKSRTSSFGHWYVYHSSIGASQAGILQVTNAFAVQTAWNSTAPTASVFSVGANVDENKSGDQYITYLWAEVPGFSKFGSYTGNGSADGPFVYTGFKPRYVMIKRTDTSGYDWYIRDTARNPFNPVERELYADLSSYDDDQATFSIDYLSNGFKVRGTHAGENASGGTYIYAAFAEQPFKLSAMPGLSTETTTARVIRLWGGVRLMGGIRLF